MEFLHVIALLCTALYELRCQWTLMALIISYIIYYSVDLLRLTNLSSIGRVCQVNGCKSFHLDSSTVDSIRRWEWAPISIITRLPDQTNSNTLVRTLSSTYGGVFYPLYKRGQPMSMHMCTMYCTVYLTGFDFKNKYLSNG